MFMKRIAVAALLAGTVLAAGQASATDRRLNIIWSGDSFGNSATATGFIEFDDTVIPNVGFQNTISTADVIDLGITITGSAGGNGTFTKSDFGSIYFATPTALDFSHELIGQTVGAGQWYGNSAANGAGGDFNLFGNGGAAPTGTWYFTLTTSGGDSMRVVSMSPDAVPEPASWAMMIGGFGMVGAAMRRRQKVQVSFG